MTVDLLVSFTTMQCGLCDHVFAVPRHTYDRFHKTGDTWYCPAGHPRVFTGESAEKKLERQLVSERARTDQIRAQLADQVRYREAAERRAAAARGQTTKLRNRVGKGVCPCCTRSFTNLRRHMATKHPEHSTAAEVAAAKKAGS